MSLAPPDTWRSDPAAVYRIYSPPRCLLYVGLTHDVAKRLAQHAQLSPWMPPPWDITHTVEWYADRDDAALAEAIAIVREVPLHNKRRDQVRTVAGHVVDLARCQAPTPFRTQFCHTLALT